MSMKKTFFITALCCMFFLASSLFLFAGGERGETGVPTKEKMEEGEVPAGRVVKNPDTLIHAQYGTIQSLDPHRAYDTASCQVVMNMYDGLIGFEGTSTDKFLPLVAEKVPSIKNGLIRDGGKTYVFPIRKGIKFHNNEEVTPEDVEYTFERAMVTDEDGGPVWMIYEPLLGISKSRDKEGNIVVDFKDIDRSVEVEGQNVVFRLKNPYPPFLAILAQSWSSILNKKYMIDNGAWDGTETNWKKYNNPEQGAEALYNKEMGCGPYKLVKWDPGAEITLERFDGYFREPASVKNIVIKVVEEWTTRKLMFTAGDVDSVMVDVMYWPEMESVEGIKIYKDLPRLVNTSVFYNFKINPEANQAIWSGRLDGQGIPPDFFTDINVRKAFAHSFDHETYIKDAFLGYAITPAHPIVKGLPYSDPDVPKYEFDQKKAKEYFMKAWDGKVWENGFKMTIMYNTGNEKREVACQMIEENVESLNPKFQIEVMNVDWGNYLNMIVAKKCTLFVLGWLADFPDPHNFVHPYMHSQGYYPQFQSYSRPEVDELIEQGIKTVDPKERKDIYSRLARIYYEDLPGFQIAQDIWRTHVRDWVSGYYWNPVRDYMVYFYTLKKGYE